MKNLLYLVVAAVVVAAVAWFVHQREAASWREQALPAGAELLAGLPVNEVATLRVQGPDGAVTLRRAPDGWIVSERADYAADFDKVSGLVRKLADLTALQSTPLAPSDRGALVLREPGGDTPAVEAGTRVELQDGAGRVLGAVLLGKSHVTSPAGVRQDIGGSVTGRYVMAGADGDHAYLVAEPFSDLRTAPSDWIRKDFVRPGAARRIEVRLADARKSWTLERPAAGAPWTLAGTGKNETADQTKLLSLDSLLSGLTVADVPDGPEDARVKPLAEHHVTVVVDSFDGLRYTLTFGVGAGDNLPARIEVEALPSPPEDQARAREETLAAAAKFRGKTVFIPRNFLEPFLQERAAMVSAPPAPQPTPVPSKNKKR